MGRQTDGSSPTTTLEEARQLPSGILPVPFMSPLDSFDALRQWADYHVVVQKKRGRTEGWFLGPLDESAVELGSPDSDIALPAHRALLFDGLAEMRERGDLRPEADPGELASALLAVLQGGTLVSEVRRDIAPLQAALDFMLDRVRSLAVDDPGDVDRALQRRS